MKIDINEVLDEGEIIISQIKDGKDYQSFLHLDAAKIAARIRVITAINPMSQEDLCYYFRRRGFGNTLMIEYMLNKYCRRLTRQCLWDRDAFGRFYPIPYGQR